MRDASLNVLQHALGLDQFGIGSMYRNHYVAGPGHHSWDLCVAHVEAGRMEQHAPRELFGGDHCFTVTESGIAFVRANSPKPPKLTRDQKRYRDFLSEREANPDLTFERWLKRRTKMVAA
jgi:hypothetical protein